MLDRPDLADPSLSAHLKGFIGRLDDMPGESWQAMNRDYAFRAKIAAGCEALLENSDPASPHRESAFEAIHDILKVIYDREFASADAFQADCEAWPILRDIASVLEGALIGTETGEAERLLEKVPAWDNDYVHWLKRLISSHRASRHPFYHAFIRDHGTREDLRYLLAQETCIDPRFDDILALIQLGAKSQAKMELASNYWDEMGNGQIADMHSALFDEALLELQVDQAYIDDNYLSEAKVCGNISAALALRRQHYYKAIGYYGVTEYLAPRRFRDLVSAWRRLGLPEKGLHYHELHIHVDAGHASGWFKNVVQPAVDRDPRVGRDIALGALIRLNTSERYLDALLVRTGTAGPS